MAPRPPDSAQLAPLPGAPELVESSSAARPPGGSGRTIAVNGLFRRETFRTFGPHALAAEQPPLFGVKARRGGRRLREPVRAECPRLPGVYGMVDQSGVLSYV